MKISSEAFKHEESIPAQYTCDGDDVSPQLSIEDVPKEAKSLALIMDDPDAPAGTWVHWTLWDISPDTKTISSSQIPQGAKEGTTSFGTTGYGGPCPPGGEHRYFFTLFALDTKLELKKEASREELGRALEGHIIETAQLMGKYKRLRT